LRVAGFIEGDESQGVDYVGEIFAGDIQAMRGAQADAQEECVELALGRVV
jgi:hypothetical protein